jgi:crossover junction endodeoxyribonuclease RusA
MSNIVIYLSWPARELFPNRSNGQHWGKRQPFKVAAKSIAFSSARELSLPNTETDHAVKIVIEPPDKRRRDLDGVLSALKPSLDGIAQALHIDDQHFNPIEIIRSDVIKNGRVMIIIDDGIPF